MLTENLMIRSATPTDADELLAIRRDAIMALAEEYGRVAAEGWATAAHPDRAANAIATNSVWVAEFGSQVVGWVEVAGATVVSLYVSPAAARLGVGSSLLTHAEREIRDAGASIACLDASPNAEAFYASRLQTGRRGQVEQFNSHEQTARTGKPPNRPLERAGVNRRGDFALVSAGRSAPMRWAANVSGSTTNVSPCHPVCGPERGRVS
jgi:putative acetyltransferase